ncbi:MAG: RelB/DinJ family addiction module antitoxin [Eggerthellaceae bacterium]|nr:RelB/DinJ family addiction module antitoxin [Eggerthellaceae bacterium]
MADAMVTGRMSQEKKDAGNLILEQLGTNASKAINDLYDYVIAHKKLPVADQIESRPLEERMREAARWFEEVSLPLGNRFATMGDDEIKRERLVARGIADWSDFS